MDSDSKPLLGIPERVDLFYQMQQIREQLRRVVASSHVHKTNNDCRTYGIRMEYNQPGSIKMAAGAHLLCPACGGEYVHMLGGTEFIEGHDRAAAAPQMVRGDVLTIPMYGECGHTFVMCLGEHKGTMEVWFVVHPWELPGEPPET